MKINPLNDIKSRDKISQEKREGTAKTNKESTKEVSKGNKRGETKGNKKEIPILPDETRVHDEVRGSSDIPSNDEDVKYDK